MESANDLLSTSIQYKFWFPIKENQNRDWYGIPLLELFTKEPPVFFKFTLVTLFSILIVLLLYNFRGNLEHTLKICESLGLHAPVRCSEWGPTYALQHDLLKDQTNQDMSFFYFQADIESWLG